MKSIRTKSAIILLRISPLLFLSGCASSSRGDFDARLEENRIHIEEIGRIMDLQLAQCHGDPDCIAKVNDQRLRLTALALERLIGGLRESRVLRRTPPETKPNF